MLRGKHVVLRPTQRTDLPKLWALLEDLEVVVLADAGPPLPDSLATYEERFDRKAKEPAKDEIWLTVEFDGQVVGDAGLYGIDHFNQRCELGISLGRAHWNKGFGQEAVHVLVNYAFSYLKMNRVGLKVLAEDPRAVGAYRKAGFTEEGRLRNHDWVGGEFHDVLVMSIMRDEWMADPEVRSTDPISDP
jgi:RimJ/RimL family protein N-acetyltransferase